MVPMSLAPRSSRASQNLRVPHVSFLSHGSRRISLIGAALILLAAAIAAAPIWIHGPTAGDDFEFHLISWLNAQQSLLHGIPYPHWAISPNFDAGEPRFVFYPPITWMLGAALGLVLPWTLVPTAITFLLLAATGFATRALTRQALPNAPATLAGCAAIFSGYALFTSYYRTAYAELAGGFWIPLLLLFALRDRESSDPLWRRVCDGSAFLLALVVAGAWLSDAPVGVMASYLLAAVATIAALLARSWFPVVRATVGFTLGVALSGFYLIPAAWEQRWVDIQQATGVIGDAGLSIENNWIFPHHTDPALSQRDHDLRFISLVAVTMVATALFGLLALWLRRRLSSSRQTSNNWLLSRPWWIPLALIPPAVLFLLLPVSMPVWNLLPKLRFLQFPWRWLLVVEAPMAIFFAAAIWPDASRRRWLRPAIACLCAVFFLASTVFAANHFFRDDVEFNDLKTMLAKYHSGAGVIGTDEYAPPGADNSVVATGLPDACLTDDFDTELGIAATPEDNPAWLPSQGSCLATATAAPRQPEHLHIAIQTPRPAFLILRLRSYPAWRIVVNGQIAKNLPARADGLIAVPVFQGPVELNADWTTTPDVIAGRWVSFVALLLLVPLGLLERRFSRTRP